MATAKSEKTYYTLVLGGPGVHSKLFMPKKVIRDANNKIRPSQYNPKEPMTTYMKQSEVTKTPTYAWCCDKDSLRETPANVKAVRTEMQNMLRLHKSAVWFHTSRDPCSLFHGPHYHFIVDAEVVGGVSQDYHFRKMRALVKPDPDSPSASKLTLTSQKVKS